MLLFCTMLLKTILLKHWLTSNVMSGQTQLKMKVCTECKLEKPITDFYKQADRSTRSSFCKPCKNKYDVLRWVEKKKKAISYKGGCCNHCGYDRYYGALQFHHLDPNEKEADWQKLRKRSWSKIKEELDKCLLLCANCHAEVHASYDL